MINVAIDGPAGSGKSTIAEILSKKLDYRVLNTGSIYRGMACSYRDKNLGALNEERAEKFLKQLKTIEIKFEGDEQHVIVDGIDYTPLLRQEEISNMASHISSFKAVRERILDIQRDFANEYNCIMDGRDIGTVVLPNAQIKIFMIASPEERANRRFKQVEGETYEEILKDIMARDYADEHRAVAPLKPADDAVILDTSDMTIEEVVENCLEIIKLKLEKRTIL